MTSNAIKKQVEGYLPLLSRKQQGLVLEMIKGLLNVDDDSLRLSKKQYNKEIDLAAVRMEKGTGVSHKDALKAMSKW